MLVGLILMAIGTLLLLEKLGIISHGLGTYWPVILIVAGLSMLFNRWRGPWRGRWQL